VPAPKPQSIRAIARRHSSHFTLSSLFISSRQSEFGGSSISWTMASSSATGNVFTINLLDSSDDDQDSIPPSSGLTFLRDEPAEPRLSQPPPARVSTCTSTHKKARTSMDTTTGTAYGYRYHNADADAMDSPPFASSQWSDEWCASVAARLPKKPTAVYSAPPPLPPKLDSVWLVYHQKEPYYHSAWSYDSHLRYGPSYIDKICVGVYDRKTLADTAAKHYWEKQVRKPVTSSHADDQVGQLGGYVYDGIWSRAMSILCRIASVWSSSPSIRCDLPRQITTRPFCSVVGACKFIVELLCMLYVMHIM
jgi:hypothetical protein